MRLYQRLRVIHDALRVGVAITLSRRSGRVIRAYISDIPGRELTPPWLELVVVQYRYHLLLCR
jgi:hypothetical protein